MTPQEFAKKQREMLIRTEKRSAFILLNEFEKMKKKISDFILLQLTGPITLKKLSENDLLKKLLSEVESRIIEIKNPFVKTVQKAQTTVIKQSGASLREFLELKSKIFERDGEAIQKLLQRANGKNTLSVIFDRMKTPVRQLAKNELIEGFALGESAPQIAARLHKTADLGKARALTIARTETNEAYRAATRDFYREANIKEYIWMSALDPRTCLICWMLHGQKFKSSKMTFSHPNCRCVLIPKTKHTGNIITGAERFAALEPGFQKQILGNKRFEIFKAGNSLDEFVKSEKSPEFGERFAIRNLDEF
ncbi:MAG: phage head morphogenesis protein [Pyrinomonadaceae bacterium]|nr:phage head morphogenesis protein [Pyrinomonadaceae bacterium]